MREAWSDRTAALVLGALFALAAPCALADSGGLCEAYLAEWARVRKELSERMDEFARLKEESIAPRIEQELAQHRARASMAKVVQAALQERSRRMAQARRKIEEDLGQERNAFERWRLCTSDARRRTGGPGRGHPEVQDRERLLARLNDLLLEEAYVQYRDHKGPFPGEALMQDTTQASQARRREWPWRDQQAPYNDRSRYGLERYGDQWNRFQGYFR